MNEGPRKIIKKDNIVSQTTLKTSLLGKSARKAVPVYNKLNPVVVDAFYEDLISSASLQ